MPPTGAPPITVSAGSREGTLAITGSRVLAIFYPPKLSGDEPFFKIATSANGGTTYFDQTVEIRGQLVVKHLVPTLDEDSSSGGVVVIGWPPVYDHIKIICSSRQRQDRTFYVLLDGATGSSGTLTLSLDSKNYPLAYIDHVGSATDEVPGMRTGRLRYDQVRGAYIFRIDDFSGPYGQPTIDMESSRQGHQEGLLSSPNLDGSAGFLTGPAAKTAQISPPTTLTTVRTIAPTSIALSSNLEDVDGDPFIYMAVKNEIWRSVQGSPVFQESDTSTATTGTTLTRTGAGWTTNEWIGFTATSDSKTLVVTGNTGTVLTGAAGWVGGTPAAGTYEMHNSVVSLTSATQIGGMAESFSRGPQNWRRLWVTGVSATSEISLYFLDTGESVYGGDGSWKTALDATGATVPAESICTVGGFLMTTTEMSDYYDSILIGTIKGEISVCRPHGGGTLLSRGIWGVPRLVFAVPGRIQFLASRFADAQTDGVYFIGGGRLYNLYWAAMQETDSLTGVFRAPSHRTMPEFPPLTCGCMWQRMPVVSDGYNIWAVEGAEVRWLGFPPGLLTQVNSTTTTWSMEIQSLTAAGDLLIAGVKFSDGTNDSIAVYALNEAAGQWRRIFGTSLTAAGAELLGCHYSSPTLWGDPAEKYLFVNYVYATQTYVYSLHLPKGIVGASGGDDEFQEAGRWYFPMFDGGSPLVDKTLLGYRIECYLNHADTDHKITVADSISATIGTIDGSTDGTGWQAKEFLLASGQGVSFKTIGTYLVADLDAAKVTHHPEVHAFEWIFNLQLASRMEWELHIDTQKWMRDNSKDIQDLLTQLTTSRDKTPQVAASITNAMDSTYVKIRSFEVQRPSDPATAPIGYTRIVLEESV